MNIIIITGIIYGYIYNMNITHPWYTYPGEPFRGYQNYELYKSELNRLYNYISNYDRSDHVFFHLTIGAAMEEALEHSQNIGDHWRQLFPYYLELFMDSDIHLELVIVSPNKNFTNIDPTFITMTNHIYNWENTDNRCYKSTTGNTSITVNIFCCPFPHYDKSTKSKIEYWKKQGMEEHNINLDNLCNTETDLLFVNSFYDNLGNLLDMVNNNGGLVACISYAVFHNDTVHRRLNNYIMFSKIKELFTKDNKYNRILCEWIYNYDQFVVFEYNTNIFINYMAPNTNYEFGYMLMPSQNTDDEFVFDLYDTADDL
jgi:hypothetical protein